LGANRSQTFLLITIALCGALIVLLSFLPWVNFDEDDPFVAGTSLAGLSFTLDGTDVSRLQGAIDLPDARTQGENACTCRADFGDGYLTAIFGAITLATAAGAVVIRSRMGVFVAGAILASLASVALGGYNATGIWEGVGAHVGSGAFLNMDGDVTFGLFALTALSALASVLGAVVLMIAVREARELEAASIEAEEGELEEAEGWA
jgi:hypothetical protein